MVSLQEALLMDHIAPRLTPDEWMMLVTKVIRRNDPILIRLLESQFIQSKIFEASQDHFSSFAKALEQNAFSQPELGPLLFQEPYYYRFNKEEKAAFLKRLFSLKNPFTLIALKSKAIMADIDDSALEDILREALGFNKNFAGLIEALALPWNAIKISSEGWTRALSEIIRLQRHDLLPLLSRNGAILSRLTDDQVAVISHRIEQFPAFVFNGLDSFLNSPLATRMPAEDWMSILEQARKSKRRDVIQKIVHRTAVMRKLPESFSTELFQWILLKEAPLGKMSFKAIVPFSRTFLASRLSRPAIPLNRKPVPGLRNLLH
jgi:hypothetical protein